MSTDDTTSQRSRKPRSRSRIDGLCKGVKEAAAKAGVGSDTISLWESDGLVSYSPPGISGRIFFTEDLKEYIRRYPNQKAAVKK